MSLYSASLMIKLNDGIQCVCQIKLTAHEEVALELRANQVRWKSLFALKGQFAYQFKAIVWVL
jgi:hypothetical protein